MFCSPCARLAGALCLVISACLPPSANAGPGHDHGSEPAAAVSPANPRLVAVSESYELVGILEHGKLIIYLDRLADTAPVGDARIELTVDGETAIAVPQADGTYVYSSPSLRKRGDHEVIAAIGHGGSNDLLVGTLKVPHADAHTHTGAEQHPSSAADHEHTNGARTAGFPHILDDVKRKLGNAQLLAGIGLAFGVMIGALVRGRTGLMLGLVGLAAVLGAGAAWAGPGRDHGGHDHGGHDQGERGAAVAQGDAPRRLADGELFLPKPTQRLLAIRTRILKPQTARRTHRLIGRIVGDPNSSGLVQSTIGGRIRVAAEGLPVLGQRVKKGQVLAYVEPAFAPIDSSDVRQTAGDLAQRIAVLDARIARQKRLVATGVVNAASLQDLEIEREGLDARRQQLARSRSEAESLIAPVDGVIAEVRIVAGQVVTSADTLFNILDPKSLWVEAISFDPRIDDADLKAKAQTSDGELFDLAFVGRSRALQQQASVLQFRVIAPSEVLNIGSPVKVLIEVGDTVAGLIVPRSAVTRAPNGQTVAFKRLQAERYLPVAIRVEEIDGERVRVTSGLSPGDQIIVEGAPLVNQVR